jgi:hypothetical protein
MKTSASTVALSLDVQCDTCQLNIVSGVPKVASVKKWLTRILWPWTNFASKSLLVKVHLKKNPEAEKLHGNRYRIKFPIDYRRVFFECVFFSGRTFVKLQVSTSTIQFLWWGLPIQAFLGPGWGEVLISSEFIWEYLHVHLQKKHTSKHPCQIWDRIWNPKRISV